MLIECNVASMCSMCGFDPCGREGVPQVCSGASYIDISWTLPVQPLFNLLLNDTAETTFLDISSFSFSLSCFLFVSHMHSKIEKLLWVTFLTVPGTIWSRDYFRWHSWILLVHRNYNKSGIPDHSPSDPSSLPLKPGDFHLSFRWPQDDPAGHPAKSLCSVFSNRIFKKLL